MANTGGTDFLEYGLYQDAALTQPVGDSGTGGTNLDCSDYSIPGEPFVNSVTFGGASSVSRGIGPFYRIPAQSVPLGTSSDTVSVEVWYYFE